MCVVAGNVVVMSLFDRSHTISYSSSFVTMFALCIVSAIQRDFGRKLQFYHPVVYITTPSGEIVANILALFFTTERYS